MLVILVVFGQDKHVVHAYIYQMDTAHVLLTWDVTQYYVQLVITILDRQLLLIVP
jgi:hypothetical protein